MYFLNIGDIFNFIINLKYLEYCCIFIDVNLGVLSYCEYKIGKDLWVIKGNVFIIYNWFVRFWFCFGVIKIVY